MNMKKCWPGARPCAPLDPPLQKVSRLLNFHCKNGNFKIDFVVSFFRNLLNLTIRFKAWLRYDGKNKRHWTVTPSLGYYGQRGSKKLHTAGRASPKGMLDH